MPWYSEYAAVSDLTSDLSPAGDPLTGLTNLRDDQLFESWIWDAACSIRGAKDAPKYKDFIPPLIFTKRLCDVFDDELNRISGEIGSHKKTFQLAGPITNCDNIKLGVSA